ncbi:hypothetical protein EMPS_01785 [Entomortierella parvispora]|uniref:INO80 complex subunit E N-terminal domain-containing protein n=1 Tax=Entomortierella parvispora TaxID=205924 RepID=A0A9P3H3L4_9FUNG|nr:hypothetical protein EMPS_01785 [Entomortierella parvispora]
MVPSNVDTNLQATAPSPTAIDVSALKDKDTLSRVEDAAVVDSALPAPQTITVEESKQLQPILDNRDGEASPELLPKAAPLQSGLSSDVDDDPQPQIAEGDVKVRPGMASEPDHEQRRQRSKRGPRPSDQDVDMNDSLPTPAPTDQDSRIPTDEKYRRLKRKLKEVLEENERLGVELDRSNRRARHLRREKNLLLDRLCAFERDSDSSPDTLSSIDSDSDLSDSSILSGYRARASQLSRPVPMVPNKNLQVPGSYKDTTTPNTQNGQHPKKTAVKPPQKRRSPAVPREVPPPPVASAITNVGSATQKPKRIHQSTKLRPNLNKVRKVMVLDKDENGNIKLPVTVGIITVMSIGHVVYDREAFHNDRYIWPVGYKMSRSYNSMIDPHQQTVYTCSVIDDGDAPKFQIDAEDQPGKPIIAGTATGAWTHIVKAANHIRRRDHSNSASGPDYFGFSNPTIAKMIQDLPNVDKCTGYIMQKFEEPSIARPEKRKVSVLDSSKSEHDDGEGEHDGDEDQNDEDEEEYASLGTPGMKKVKRSPSPKIRQAGFDAPRPTQEDYDEDIEVEEEDVDELEELEGDAMVVSDMDGVVSEVSSRAVESVHDIPVVIVQAPEPAAHSVAPSTSTSTSEAESQIKPAAAPSDGEGRGQTAISEPEIINVD